MSTDPIRQFRCHNDACKRILDFMTDENIQLKNVISLFLDRPLDEKSLEKIEGYYSRLLKADELITILKNDLTDFDLRLNRQGLHDINTVTELQNITFQIKGNIETAEKEFILLRNDFNTYMVTEL
jgi:hypothetical protein